MNYGCNPTKLCYWSPVLSEAVPVFLTSAHWCMQGRVDRLYDVKHIYILPVFGLAAYKAVYYSSTALSAVSQHTVCNVFVGMCMCEIMMTQG